MNQRSEHLSNAQIEQYGKRASGAGPETEAWVETHLDDCPSCRSRVLEFQRTQFALLPAPKVNTVSSSNCPSEEDLRTLAAGLCADPLATELTAHAAACGHCCPLLREYQEDFSDNVTPEEQTALAQLRSASPEWQQQKAREMLKPVRTPAPSPPSPRSIFSWKWIMTPAAAATACALLALGIGGVTWYAQRDTPEKVEKLLAQAYTEQRTMELRWPGARYTPLHRVREADPDQRANQSPSLLQAEGIIAKNSKTRENVSWLRVQAEAELLEGHPKVAIEELNSALKLQPDSAPLLIDLSIAYFQLGETLKDPGAYRTSLEFSAKVLEREPDNTVARFNQALAFERLGKPQNAVSAWKTLLASESDPGWVEEAQRHLKMLEH